MSEPIIRELQDTDYEALAAYNAKFPDDKLDAAKWLERFKHWWDFNPAYDSTWKRGFLMESDNTIVGWVGSFPSLFKAGDKVVTAFNGTTWRVLPEYRQWSIDLWGCNREVSKHYLSFNTTPLDEIIPLIRRFKYGLYPWGEEKLSYIVARPRAFMRAVLSRSKSWMAGPAALTMKLDQLLHPVRGDKGIRVEFGMPEDEELNALWDEFAKHVAYTNVRDAACVRWYASGRLMAGIYDSTGLLACAIFGVHIHQKHGHSELLLEDLWLSEPSLLKKVLASLLEETRKYACKNKLDLVRIPHFNKNMSSQLAGFRLRFVRYHHKGFARISKEQNMVFTEQDSWFSMLQGDYDT